MSKNRGPGYKENPEHRIALAREAGRVRVVASGETIADSGEAITLHEAAYPPVHYIPRKHVRMDALVCTDHHTYCPYKGEASYFNICLGGNTIENAVWSCEHPFDEVKQIGGYLAFYPRKVDRIEVD